jgi:hypothetical protein
MTLMIIPPSDVNLRDAGTAGGGGAVGPVGPVGPVAPPLPAGSGCTGGGCCD